MENYISKQKSLYRTSLIFNVDKIYIKRENVHLILNLTKKVIDQIILPLITNYIFFNSSYYICISDVTSDTRREFKILNDLELQSYYYAFYPETKLEHDHLQFLYLSLEIAYKKAYDATRLLSELKEDYRLLLHVENSNNAFDFLTSLQKTSQLDKFLIYHYLVSINKGKKDFIFKTNSFNSFKNKINDYCKHGCRCFLHSNKHNTNAEIKFDNEDKKILKDGYEKGYKTSFRQLTKKLNTNRLLRGASKVSVQTVINRIKRTPDFGSMYIKRMGSEYVNDLLFHPLRIQPEYPGDQYQIDGTRLNIPVLNDIGKTVYYNLTALIDVYSRRIVGYTLSKTETFKSYFDVISQSIKECGHLPAEILSDNLSSLKSREAVNYFLKLQKLGVVIRKHTPKNPSDKSAIERWFEIFNQIYLKDVSGFLGDGNKSKNKDGKPNENLRLEYLKKSNMRSLFELNELLRAMIIKYNSTYSYNNSIPNLLFSNSLMINKFDTN